MNSSSTGQRSKRARLASELKWLANRHDPEPMIPLSATEARMLVNACLSAARQLEADDAVFNGIKQALNLD